MFLSLSRFLSLTLPSLSLSPLLHFACALWLRAIAIAIAGSWICFGHCAAIDRAEATGKKKKKQKEQEEKKETGKEKEKKKERGT